MITIDEDVKMEDQILMLYNNQAVLFLFLFCFCHSMPLYLSIHF